MKTFTKIQRNYEEDALSEIKCDICGKVSKSNWREEFYDATETSAELKTGRSYPEGGDGEKYEIDICPECFKKKLIPFVETFGISKIHPKRWDY